MTKRPKPRLCRCGCGERFIPTQSIQPTTPNFECKVRYAEMVASKSAAKREKAERRRVKERKQSMKKYGEVIADTQKAFNAFIRERDKRAGFPCISSGRPLNWNGNKVDSGHYRSTGSAPHLRFDERNCHAQSKYDNRWLAGSAVDYRLGLIARIGLAEVEALEADQTPRKYSKDELRAIEARYKMKLRELKQSNGD